MACRLEMMGQEWIHNFQSLSINLYDTGRMHALVCGCSSGCNLAKYPQDMQIVDGMRLRTLNTQVAELQLKLRQSQNTGEATNHLRMYRQVHHC